MTVLAANLLFHRCAAVFYIGPGVRLAVPQSDYCVLRGCICTRMCWEVSRPTSPGQTFCILGRSTRDCSWTNTTAIYLGKVFKPCSGNYSFVAHLSLYSDRGRLPNKALKRCFMRPTTAQEAVVAALKVISTLCLQSVLFLRTSKLIMPLLS